MGTLPLSLLRVSVLPRDRTILLPQRCQLRSHPPISFCSVIPPLVPGYSPAPTKHAVNFFFLQNKEQNETEPHPPTPRVHPKPIFSQMLRSRLWEECSCADDFKTGGLSRETSSGRGPRLGRGGGRQSRGHWCYLSPARREHWGVKIILRVLLYQRPGSQSFAFPELSILG